MGFSYQHNDSRPSKVALRRVILATRRSMPPAVRRSADAAIAAAAVAEADRWGARLKRRVTVAAYWAMSDEPGAGLCDRLVAAGHDVLLPLLLPDNDLDWALHTGETTPGPGRLVQPAGPPLGPEAMADADIVLVPALGVASDGTRLGRGGGSYDRALTRVRRDATVVALLYDGEWPHPVPAQAHDRPVNAVITPTSGLVAIAL
ncbi:MAG TPA: 5-formyltetrahydrofolate cyclo-ligase [Candidatus Stackebrandtia excrementipullorum]|nr:5-formyltetrahydrofolate cyclo-ligase [Candidatus Stackebrandtia excrementipullorum]